MDLELTETQRLVRDTARSFARERIAPRAKMHDREEHFPAELLREMAGLGLMGVNVPESLGGAEAGAVAYALAMMEIAEACASTSVAMGVNNMCAELIARFGADAQKQRAVAKITSGDAVAAFALSEPHCGSDAASLRTTATRKGDAWVLNGTKQWITSGTHAQVMVLWARTSSDKNKGVSAFLVEGRPRGLTAGKPEDKLGLRGSNTVALTFEDCAIPGDAMLGQPGDGMKIALTALDGGRIGIACQACGVARACLEASTRYAKERKAFEQPIAEFQAIRWFLANMKVELSAAELLALRAASQKEQGRPFSKEASMAKVFAAEMANRAADKAVQIHGGYGYLDEFPVERYFRDARVQTIYEGTSEIQRIVIAREIFKAAGA